MLVLREEIWNPFRVGDTFPEEKVCPKTQSLARAKFETVKDMLVQYCRIIMMHEGPHKVDTDETVTPDDFTSYIVWEISEMIIHRTEIGVAGYDGYI